MLFFKSKSKKNSRSKLADGFFKPQLLPLETRINPVLIQGNVSWVNGALQIQLTSNNTGPDANQVAISNASSGSVVLVDALGTDSTGTANTLNLTNLSPANLTVSQISSTSFSIDYGSNLLSNLNLLGGLGQDEFTIGNLNSGSAPLKTSADFGILVDSATVASGSIFDSLTISGEVTTKGQGTFLTSNSQTSNLNLGRITIDPLGAIYSSSGNISLTANAQNTSDLNILSGALIQTGTGAINLTSGNNSSLSGNIYLSGSALVTNGGVVNFNSGVVLSADTTINTGSLNTGSINFNSSLDGASIAPSQNLTLQTGGTIVFNGAIGAITPMGNVIIDSLNPSALTINNGINANSLTTLSDVDGSIQISGNQNYLSTSGLQLKTIGGSGDVKLLGNITFASTGTKVDVTHSGILLIGGNIGNIDDSKSIFLGAQFSENNVSGSGALTAVSFPSGEAGVGYAINDTVIITSAGSTLAATGIVSQLGSNNSISGITITFGGAGFIPGEAVTIVPGPGSSGTNAVGLAGNSKVIFGNSSQIRFVADQGSSNPVVFNTPVQLDQNTTIVTGSGQGIVFNNTVDGSANLRLISTGSIDFNANVGFYTPVSLISTEPATLDQAQINSRNPSGLNMVVPNTSFSAGSLVGKISGNVNIPADQVYTGAGGMNLVTYAGATGPGNIIFGNISSLSGSSGSLNISNSGILQLNGNINLDGSFTQSALIQGITINYPGTNYVTNPAINITGGGGTGAIATSTLSISSVNLINGGTYVNGSFPVFFSEGTNISASGTATAISGTIQSVSLTGIGNGYTNLNNLAVVGGSGGGAVVNGTGFVDAINLVSQGSGYTSQPVVTFTGGIVGAGSTATATAILSTSSGRVETGSIEIRTNGQDIRFTSDLVLKNSLVLNTGNTVPGNIFLGNVDGATPASNDLQILSIGDLTFNGSVGSTIALGAINASGYTLNSLSTGPGSTVINAASLNASVTNQISISADQNYSGTLDYSVSKTNPQIIGLSLKNTQSGSSITLGGLTTTELSTGKLSEISITAGGNGYTISPNVSISGGGGSNASAKSFLSIKNIQNINYGGVGYFVGDTVRITGGTTTAVAIVDATNLVNGSITALRIVNGGSGFTNLAGLPISGGSGLGAIVDAFGEVNSIVLTNQGNGYLSTPSVTISNAAGDIFGSGANAIAVLQMDPTPVNINNAGPLYLTTNISVGGSFNQIGAGQVFLGVKATPIIPFTFASQSGYDMLFSGKVNLLTDTVFNSNGGNITFNQLIDGDYGMTINALGGEILIAKQIGFNPVGDLIFNGASKISIIGDILASSLLVDNSTGPVILSGKMTFSGTSANSLNITTTNPNGDIVIQKEVNTTGNIILNNTGKLILGNSADFNLTSGSFQQTGSGNVVMGGDILAQVGDITFSGPVNLSGTSSLKALRSSQSASSIIFGNSVNGPGGVEVESTGSILFAGDSGVTSPLSFVTILNSIQNQNFFATQFGGRLISSVLSISNSSGNINFIGSANIQNQLNISNKIYNLIFTGLDNSIGGLVGFNNSGLVSFSNSTIFSGSAVFSQAGSLDMGGRVTFSGSFESKRSTRVTSPLYLNLGATTNKISGALSGSALFQEGSGTLVLTGDSPSYANTITVTSGSLQISAYYNKAKINIDGGTLLGGGQVYQVIGTNGKITPGAPYGTLGVLGDLALDSKMNFIANIGATSVGRYGQVRSSGLVNLGSAALNIVPSANLGVGQQITLINKTGVGPVSGTFNGLPEGQSFKVGTYTFAISYVGGDGNDVTLTIVSNNPPAPAPGFNKFFAVGTDSGGAPVVQINYQNGSSRLFYAYSPSYTGGVRVAIGDINGDGFDDLITGTGIGGGPHIKVFDLRGGLPVCVASFFAFEPTFTGGTYLASGNINGDGYADIIIGAGVGGGPRVKTYYGTNGYLINNFLAPPNLDFFAYDPNFRGGVVVAAGDRDADGVDDIITGAGIGGGPNIRSFNAASIMIDNFFAFNPAITTGIFVAAGYVNGDSIADILVGTGRGTPTLLTAFYSPGATGNAPTTVTTAPFTTAFTGGARPGVMMKADGTQVFGVAAGPTGAPEVRALNLNLQTTDAMFAINPLFNGGVFLNTTL